MSGDQCCRSRWSSAWYFGSAFWGALIASFVEAWSHTRWQCSHRKQARDSCDDLSSASFSDQNHCRCSSLSLQGQAAMTSTAAYHCVTPSVSDASHFLTTILLHVFHLAAASMSSVRAALGTPCHGRSARLATVSGIISLPFDSYRAAP